LAFGILLRLRLQFWEIDTEHATIFDADDAVNNNRLHILADTAFHQRTYRIAHGSIAHRTGSDIDNDDVGGGIWRESAKILALQEIGGDDRGGIENLVRRRREKVA
jgi:hypothetical protein